MLNNYKLDLGSKIEKTLTGIKGMHTISLDYSLEVEHYFQGHDLSKYNVYTDGSFSRGLNRGGYGLVMFKLCGDKVFITTYTQGYKQNNINTNNRMELSAILRALSLVKFGGSFAIYSDSKYCINSIGNWLEGQYVGTPGWCVNWAANGWINSENKPVKNQDLIQGILQKVKDHKSVKFTWVRGHFTSKFNNIADELATLGTELAR